MYTCYSKKIYKSKIHYTLNIYSIGVLTLYLFGLLCLYYCSTLRIKQFFILNALQVCTIIQICSKFVSFLQKNGHNFRSMSMEQFSQQPIKSVDYFFPHRTTTLFVQEKWISGGVLFYAFSVGVMNWFVREKDDYMFVFLYHWHFGGLWTTFLQIIMSKFNVMNFHHLFYKTSYFTSYDSTSILKLYLLPSFWCMKHYSNFNFFV